MAIQTRVFLLLAVSMCLLSSAVDGLACTCAPPPGAKTVREVAAWQSGSAEGSKVIFEGSVEKQEVKTGPIGAPSNAMSMTVYGAHRIVTIRVSRAYRGQTEGRTTVLTGMGGGDCGFDFETGKDYLVYADSIDGGILFTSICTGTAPLEEAGPALRLLRGDPPSADDLLDPQSYYRKYSSQWMGKVCGRLTKPDGRPLGKAQVEMSQVRDEPLPPKTASDPNLSKPDGSFCVAYISPGKYLLTAQDYDYHASFRWMGYYPGVTKHSEALPIEVKAGANLSDLQFTVQKQSLYTVRFRVVTSDGSPLPWRNLGVAIDSPDRDPLAYHESHGVNEDGSYTLGLIPPGRYFVSSFIEPDFETSQVPAEVSKWRMAKQEADISGDTEVVLKLVSVKQRE